MIERSIAATTHGRYLVEAPAADAIGVLVGFHGYAEAAEAQFARLRAIAGADRWCVVAIQGLHRFYERRTNQVIASWMTRQDREVAIADNLEYVERTVQQVSSERPELARTIFAGFSQGVAMTFRAACAGTRPIDAVIAVGGDVPPEIEPASLARIPTAILCRGSRDEWYTAAKFQSDIARLRDAGVKVHMVEFDGGHEWSAAVLDAAAAILR